MKRVYLKGDDFTEEEFRFPTYGITEAYVDGGVEHGNKIEVYNDEQLRDRIIGKLNGHQIQGECSVCGKSDACTHFDFYVTGSEGVWLCQSCQYDVMDFLRTLYRVSSQTKKNVYKKIKKGE